MKDTQIPRDEEKEREREKQEMERREVGVSE